ncbi:FAD binding domain-containing protein [Macrophomina phaseolina]|uniref:FAD binding domain-containing protein n=1 Tax=Macrophomina phaseolina TaxID=35725 RepID=A0ABQ8GZ46_9PEZI|nr:FAD binding domain-containing protein [Macrophomina phaseolina]
MHADPTEGRGAASVHAAGAGGRGAPPGACGAEGEGKRGLAEDESFQVLHMLQRRARRHGAPLGRPLHSDAAARLALQRRAAARLPGAGDACHTNSPKAAQSMNVGVSDVYNLTWMLALVLRGLARPSLLATYEHEHRSIARQPIDFDRKFAAEAAARPPRRRALRQPGTSTARPLSCSTTCRPTAASTWSSSPAPCSSLPSRPAGLAPRLVRVSALRPSDVAWLR